MINIEIERHYCFNCE